jgi:hypothetical protein
MHESEPWPALPLASWRDTCETIHMWTQIIGKIRLKLSPPVNHWWHVPLYVTSRGLTTSPIPSGSRTFDATFDFIDHLLILQTSDGVTERLPLQPQSVANFYHEVMAAFRRLVIPVRIWTMPSEVPAPIRFEQDQQHHAYDAEYAHRFWRALLSTDEILKEFRTGFIGKASPVHFFWGGFDLAATRFSGRRAPERPGADLITREGYSHEVSSCGLWFGSGSLTGPAFYSYAAPEPEGFRQAAIRPAAAFYSTEFSNFLLLYDDLRRAADPRATLLEFLQSTYDAAATLGRWDREALERPNPLLAARH